MKLQLKSRKVEQEDVETFIFRPERPIVWQAGQYLHYILPHPNPDDRGIERWFTIASAPFEKHIQVTTRFTQQAGSTFKKALRSMKIGDYLKADGPKGEFVNSGAGKKPIFIAGGIGITPFRAMLLQLDHDGQDINVELLYVNRDDNLVFEEELTKLETKHAAFHIQRFIGDKRIEKADFADYINDANSIFYISGPKPMVENYQHSLTSLAVNEDRIKTDYFPGY